MGDQFGVDPDSLHSLAGTFVREANALKNPIAAFTSAANEIGEAFGLLGACDGAADQYRKLQQHTSTTLGKLPEVLHNDAERLRGNATNYAHSDQVARRHMESVRSGGGL